MEAWPCSGLSSMVSRDQLVHTLFPGPGTEPGTWDSLKSTCCFHGISIVSAISSSEREKPRHIGGKVRFLTILSLWKGQSWLAAWRALCSGFQWSWLASLLPIINLNIVLFFCVCLCLFCILWVFISSKICTKTRLPQELFWFM